MYINFSGNLKNSHGQYSDNQISRCKITGSVGKGIEEMFQLNIVNKFVSTAKSSKYTDKNSISKFLATYAGERLFCRVRNRQFKGFENFRNVVDVKKNANEANEIFY